MTKLMTIILCAGWLLIAALVPVAAGLKHREYQAVLVTYDEQAKTVVLHPGDVLLVETKKWPVVPNYFSSKVGVKLTGDRVLDFLCQSGAPVESDFDPNNPKVGSSSWTAFFYVRGYGETKIELWLEDKNGKRIDGYEAKYIVKAKK